MVTKYVQKYQTWTDWAQGIWRDKGRPDYEADVWFNKNLNRIALEMIGDKARRKRVLALGSAMWADRDLLKALKAREYLRTDLIDSEGIKLRCDACYLPFQDGSFDFVLCRELIEHVVDDRKLLQEIYRVLNYNGWLFLTTPNILNILPDGNYHVRGYLPSHFGNILEHFGFKVMEKRADLPNVHYSLMMLGKTGIRDMVLEEFKNLSKIYDQIKDSYYFGSHLMALAQKGVYASS